MSNFASGNKPAGIVDLDSVQTLENKTLDSTSTVLSSSIETPSRLDAKQDTKTNLDVYAGTASDGQFCFATDEKTMYQVVDSALVPVGAGGASLDFFYSEDFRNTVAAELQLTGTLTVADNTVTPISGDSSIKATQAAGSLGAILKSPISALVLDVNQKDTTISIQGRYLYDGEASEIDMVIYDETNSAVLSRSSLPVASSAKTFRVLANTISTTSEISYYFEVMTENIGAILEFDNLEARVNPLATIESVETQSSHYTGQTGYSSSNTKVPYFGSEVNATGSSQLYSVDFDNATTGMAITILSPCIIDVTYFGISAGATDQYGISLDSSDLSTNIANITAIDRVAYDIPASASQIASAGTGSLSLVAGQVLRPQTSAQSVSEGEINITAQATSANVVFEGQTSELDWQDGELVTIDATVTAPTKGTTVADNITYRRVGDSAEIKMEYKQSTTGSAGSGNYLFTLPDGLIADLSNITETTDTDPYQLTNSLGSAIASAGGDLMTGSVVIYNSTQFRIIGEWTSSKSYVRDAIYHMGEAEVGYTATFTVPIQGWKASDIIMSVPVTNEVENVYSARIANDGTASITSESAPFIESVSRTGVGLVTVTFKTGFFSEVPSISLTSDGNSDAYISVAAAPTVTSFTTRMQNDAGTSEEGDFAIQIQRQGADYKHPKGYFLGNLSQPVGYLKDVKASGTNGGTSSTSWATRDLNTTEGDFDLFGTLSSNQFTLEAGKYEIEASSTFYYLNAGQIKLVQDPSGTPSDAIIGSSGRTSAGSTNEFLPLTGMVTIPTSTTFEIQMKVGTASGGTDGLGLAANLGVDEVYSTVKIRRLR